jgi:signal transduction histidine kinase/DNA-binding response OmpR family regulator/CHASE3 domain sensor protein
LPQEARRQKKALERRLYVALMTPVVLLLGVALILGAQLIRMVEHASAAQHSSDVLAQLFDMQREIVDQETAVRGYIIAGDPIFLAPFQRARVHARFEELGRLVAEDTNQRRELSTLTRRYENWRAKIDPVLRPSGADADVPAMLERKRRMDLIRETLATMIVHERALFATRTRASTESRTTTVYLFVGLFFAVAMTLALLSRRQLSGIADTYEVAMRGEREARRAIEAENFVRTGQAALSDEIMGEMSLDELARRALDTIAAHVGADVGALFLARGNEYELASGHGLGREHGRVRFAAGEGLVGRVAASKTLLHLCDVPEDYLLVRSGLGERVPCEIVLVPAVIDGRTRAVLELGFLRSVGERELALLARVGDTLAVGARSAAHVTRLHDLLEESQRQSEELETQQEELRVSNEELEERSRTLREAQALLEERHEELMTTNARLAEQAEHLELARRDIAAKAEEVSRASQYKSEFLANMSHELRTPLNSTLILAKLLADNKGGNLTAEQVKFASTIHGAGNDLLALINDVLDLSKIEAGKSELMLTLVPIAPLVESLSRLFEAIARDKNIAFRTEITDGTPPACETDAGKLDQILKNLLSNALKFTERGEVVLHVSKRDDTLVFVVRDSGIGIAPDQTEIVFEAFRQVDGASNRKYGGTGLGLSISRDLARLLGGDIEVASTLGVGSTFTLVLPVRQSARQALARAHVARDGASAERPYATAGARRAEQIEPSFVHASAFPDDRATLDRSRRSVLIVEDDVTFAEIVAGAARELGFQCIVTHTASGAIALANQYTPSAIVLDMHLPDHSGLSVLDRLKHDSKTRHIPVHALSVANFTQSALALGAIGYAQKPAKREELASIFETLEARIARAVRRILVVEDDVVQRESIERLLAGPDVEIVAVGTTEAAIEALRASTFDCVVTDLALPGASGFDLLEAIAHRDASSSVPPVIVYTARTLTPADEQRLVKYSSSIIVKDARSPERLLDEVTLFLHRVEAELPVDHQRMLRAARDRESLFEGRVILVVEDDVRNVFALSSILEPKGATVVIARNGREALEVLERTPETSLVLMDIMMPEMDGLTAMRRIRARPEWAKLPIIALTAKAMKDDRDLSLKAGANDYVTKPLDIEMLLSLLRVWMPR